MPALNTVICRDGDDRASGVFSHSQESSVNLTTAVGLRSAQRSIVMKDHVSAARFLSHFRVFLSKQELKCLYFLVITILAINFPIQFEKSVFWDSLVVWLGSALIVTQSVFLLQTRTRDM